MAAPFSVVHEVTAKQFESFLVEQLRIGKALQRQEVPWILSATSNPAVFVSEVRTPEALTDADRTALTSGGRAFPPSAASLGVAQQLSSFELLLTARLDLDEQAIALRDTAMLVGAIQAGLRDSLPAPVQMQGFGLAVSFSAESGSMLVSPNLKDVPARYALENALDGIASFVSETTTRPWPVLSGSRQVLPLADAEIRDGLLNGWYGPDPTQGPRVGPVRLNECDPLEPS